MDRYNRNDGMDGRNRRDRMDRYNRNDGCDG
jgi:hypothetical protein